MLLPKSASKSCGTSENHLVRVAKTVYHVYEKQSNNPAILCLFYYIRFPVKKMHHVIFCIFYVIIDLFLPLQLCTLVI